VDSDDGSFNSLETVNDDESNGDVEAKSGSGADDEVLDITLLNEEEMRAMIIRKIEEAEAAWKAAKAEEDLLNEEEMRAMIIRKIEEAEAA
jgi:hypothetical protein